MHTALYCEVSQFLMKQGKKQSVIFDSRVHSVAVSKICSVRIDLIIINSPLENNQRVFFEISIEY